MRRIEDFRSGCSGERDVVSRSLFKKRCDAAHRRQPNGCQDVDELSGADPTGYNFATSMQTTGLMPVCSPGRIAGSTTNRV